MIRGSEQTVHRGEVVFIDLPDVGSSVQRNIRPCVIISNDKNNKFAPIITVVPLSSKMCKKPLPTHTLIEKDADNGLITDSVALGEQILTVGKDRIKSIVGRLNEATLSSVNNAVLVQMGLCM